MSIAKPVGQPLEGHLAEMPASPTDPQTKGRLVEFCRALDRVGRFDDLTQQAYIDEELYRRLSNEFSSSSFTEQLIAHLKQVPGNIIRSSTGQVAGAVKSITWLELATHLGDGTPAGKVAKDLHLSGSSTVEEIQQAIRQHYPQASAVMFDPAALGNLVAKAIDHPSHATGAQEVLENVGAIMPSVNWNYFWSCMSRSAPGWFIVGLMGAFWGGVISGNIIGVLIGFAIGFGFMFVIDVIGCLSVS